MPAESGQNDRLNVFISYSRADIAFANEMVAALEFAGFAVSIDRHSIREGEEWKARIGSLIAEADTVVFVLSPDSVKSPICVWEVEEAAALSKRILPVLCRPLADIAAPPRLAQLNYVRFDENRSFMAGLKGLVSALNTDLDWLRDHTVLLRRASEWERGGRTENRLMSGKDIADAKAWADRRPRNAPELLPLQLDYIAASEAAERARNDAARQQIEERTRLLNEAEAATALRAQALAKAEEALKTSARLQRRQALGGAVALLVLSVVGWWGYGVVSEQRAIAREANREDIRGQVVSYATARGEEAIDKAPGHDTSAYTTAISKTLYQKNKTIVDALVDAHKEVTILSDLRQRPFLSTSMNGHIYLAKQPATRKKRAILVSVDDPNIGKNLLLEGPKHDVAAVSAALIAMGFPADTLRRLHNPNREQIEAEIEKVGRELVKDAKPEPGQPPSNTLLVFFFSGHGAEVEGIDYIIPSLAHGRLDRPEDVALDAVSTQRLTKSIDNIAAASVVILDTHFPAIFAPRAR